MTEHTLLAALLKVLRGTIVKIDHGVIFKHADYSTTGIPDVSVTLHGKTSWWEVKHVTTLIHATGLQLQRARELAAAGSCWFVVYVTMKDGMKRTCLVHPNDFNTDNYGYFDPIAETHGHNHQFVLDFIQRLHPASTFRF